MVDVSITAPILAVPSTVPVTLGFCLSQMGKGAEFQARETDNLHHLYNIPR